MKTLKTICLSIVVVSFFITTSFAQTTSEAKPLPIDPSVKVGKLDNGMVYYIKQNKQPENRIEMRLAVNAGSILETNGQQGLAHFTEHMAFNGSKNFPKNELVDYLQKIGMKFGSGLNAYTGFDETVYMLKVPADKEEFIDKGFLVLEDWAHNLTFDAKEIDKERGIIVEEWRTGLGAEDRMMKKYFPVIFKGSRYAERLPIGKVEILQSFKHDTLRRFYADWYRPNLQAIMIVGDIDPAKAEQKIIEHFASFKNPENPKPRASFDMPDNKDPLISMVTDKEATNTMLLLFYKHPRKIIKTIPDYKIKLMNDLAISMLNQRLSEITKNPEAPFTDAGVDYGIFLARSNDAFLSYALLKENQVEKGLQTVLTENERLKRFGFTQTELDRQKDELLSNLEKASKEIDKTESDKFITQYVSNFLTEDPIPGIKNELKYAKKYLPEITLDDINNLTKAWVTDENLVVLVTAPEKDNIKIPNNDQVVKTIAQVKQSTIAPYVDKFKTAPLLSKTLKGSKATSRKENKELGYTEIALANGVQVILKPTDFKNDEILFSAYSLGGHSLYSTENFMSASYADQIINESGIGEFDNIELEKKLKGKIVEVSPYISDVKEGFQGKASPKDFETLLQLTYLYFDSPRKDTTAYKATISNVKNQLKFISSSPVYAFLDSLVKTSTQNDPRTIVIPTEAQLNAINLDTLYKEYKDRFADASDFKFFIVGNINVDSITPMLEKYLGSLPNINRKETWKDVSPEFPTGIKDIAIYKGSEPKSMVGIIMSEEFEWNDKNKLSLTAIEELLDIKLIEVIREQLSGVYSPQIQMQFEQYPKSEFSLMIMFGCSPNNADKLTKAVFKVISQIQKKGPSEKDLNKVKEALIRDREINMKKNNFWLNKLENSYFNNEDVNSINTFNQRVNELTIDDVKKAAQLYLKKDHYVRGVLYPEKKK